MHKVIRQCQVCSWVKRLWTGATVKIPAVCLTGLRGGAELQAERERSRAREKEIRLKSERGKCSHSQGLWAPYIAANYLLNEVISFRTAERQLMWLAIKCPYFSLSLQMPFLLLALNSCSCQVSPVLQSAVVCCQIMITTVSTREWKLLRLQVTVDQMLIEAIQWFNVYMTTVYGAIKAPSVWFLLFLEAGVIYGFITDDTTVYSLLPKFTILYIPAYKGSAFFTGRSLSLLDRCCRFLPVSFPYPQGSQPTAPWQVLNTSHFK